MANPENLQGQGFHTNPERINKKGRPVSIKTAVKRILEKNGHTTIKAKDVIKIKENGDVVVKLIKQDEIALKLVQFTKKGNGDALKAIQMLMEQFDGKPRQAVTFDSTAPEPFDILAKRPEKSDEE